MRSLYNRYNRYTMMEEDYETIKSNNFKRINRFNIRYPAEFDGNLMAHVFLTTPDLNLLKGNGQLQDGISSIPFFKQIYREDKRILEALTSTNGNFLNYHLTNMLHDAPLQDINLNVIESNKSLSGWVTKYKRHDVESRSGNTISLNFGEDKNLTTYKMLKAWYLYIKYVSQEGGLFKPKDKYIESGKLDYAVTLYLILTGRDGKSIKYYAVLVGLSPNSLPTSKMSTNNGEVEIGTYDVPFDMYVYDDLNPISLMNMYNSNADNGRRIASAYDPRVHDRGDTWTKDPIIRYAKGRSNLELLYTK